MLETLTIIPQRQREKRLVGDNNNNRTCTMPLSSVLRPSQLVLPFGLQQSIAEATTSIGLFMLESGHQCTLECFQPHSHWLGRPLAPAIQGRDAECVLRTSLSTLSL